MNHPGLLRFKDGHVEKREHIEPTADMVAEFGHDGRIHRFEATDETEDGRDVYTEIDAD
jgi:hypothetical protein